jgi:hypothetical protein
MDRMGISSRNPETIYSLQIILSLEIVMLTLRVVILSGAASSLNAKKLRSRRSPAP